MFFLLLFMILILPQKMKFFFLSKAENLFHSLRMSLKKKKKYLLYLSLRRTSTSLSTCFASPLPLSIYIHKITLYKILCSDALKDIRDIEHRAKCYGR